MHGVFFFITMKTEKEITEKLVELRAQKDYLNNFVGSFYKETDITQKAEHELTAFSREIAILEWVILDELPF